MTRLPLVTDRTAVAGTATGSYTNGPDAITAHTPGTATGSRTNGHTPTPRTAPGSLVPKDLPAGADPAPENGFGNHRARVHPGIYICDDGATGMDGAEPDLRTDGFLACRD